MAVPPGKYERCANLTADINEDLSKVVAAGCKPQPYCRVISRTVGCSLTRYCNELNTPE